MGGIDGFSGLPVMLKCTDINNADTTLRCFLEAVNTYGPPSRVQTDQGLQECKLCTINCFMLWRMKESFIGSMTSMWLFSTMFFCKKIPIKLNMWNRVRLQHRLRTVRSSPVRMWVAGQLQTPVGIEF